jgi:hypothetical protein
LISVIAFDNLERVAHRANNLLQANRGAFQELLHSCAAIEYVWPEHGTVVFPKLLSRKNAELYQLLREKYDTSVVPGEFFYMPDHFRVGLGGDTQMTREALERLRQALDELA